ncbi:MAG: DUF1667 domain-containing protein [Eubacteriales bacterium]|nr:DUF1667 domain-containing protein [Eubacteriales bacterium]
MQNAESQQTLICIVCPRGCQLTAGTGQDGRLEISGNSCPRGIEYARQELTAPMRVLTALMRLQDMEKPVSVKTDRPVPKELLFDCAAEIYRTHPASPVHRGDILIRDLCGTGCNVIATRDASAGTT